MAALSRSRRSAAGVAFIIAGAVLLLAVLLPYIGVGLGWLVAVGFGAITAGLVILALGAVNNTVARVALVAGALGWFVLTLARFGLGLPAEVATIGAFAAALGTLVGAIVLYTGREVVQVSGTAFIVTAILGVVFLLPRLGVTALDPFSTVWTVAFAIALILTGVYFRGIDGSRRR